MNSIAESTKKTRLGQWRCYTEACLKFGWDVFPCNVEQACMYVSYLARKLRFSSIKAYYQSVIFFHVCAGWEPVRMSNPVLKATLKGIEKLKSGDSKGKDPMLPEHLKKIMRVLDLSSDLELLVYVSSLFMFRTLLRISNIVISPHTLRVRDVRFSDAGCLVYVNSSKTTTSQDDSTVLPLLFSTDKNICAASWLLYMVKRFKPKREDYLFSAPSLPGLTYVKFAKKFKDLTIKAGLVGDFASHSLRRGGATFMSMLERPLDQIKARGLWKSDCVYRYIAPPLSAKIAGEAVVASYC